MKKFILTFVMVCGIVSATFSQNWFVGAGVNLWFSKDSDFSEIGGIIVEREIEIRTIGISPEIGYRINKFDFGVNPRIQYNYTYVKQNSDSLSQTDLSFGIGLFSRYNFITFFDRLSILGKMDINYLFSKRERDNASQEEFSAHRIGLSISPVIEFRLSNHLSLYSSIIGDIVSIDYQYSSMSRKNSNEFSRDGHSFIFSLPSAHTFSVTNFSLGFYVTF